LRWWPRSPEHGSGTYNRLYSQTMNLVAMITRFFHPPGTMRLLRAFYDPECMTRVSTVIPYDGDSKIHIDTSSFIEWVVFFFGYYEKQIVDLIKKYMPVGGTLVDVGANVGTMTLIGAKRGKVYAFEPLPAIAERLEDNVALNGFGERVFIIRSAASDSEGEVRFKEQASNDSNRGTGSIRGDGNLIVKTTTIDAVVPPTEHVDVIKIDAEGHDARVLIGAQKTIERCKPVLIVEDLTTIPFVEKMGYTVRPFGNSFVAIPIFGSAKK